VEGGGSEEMRKGVEVIALSLSLTVIAIALIAVSSAGAPPPPLKYNIDGNLSDWGVNLTGNWSLNETWVPNEGIEFVVEDNNDPHHVRYATGVHIKGVGSHYEYYYEPKVSCNGKEKVEPIGDEPYDVEAKYLDEDENYIYVAIVTSMNPNGSGNLEPIDFAMNLDGDDSTGEYGYEYGVKLHESDGIPQWNISYLPDWAEPGTCPDNAPGKMVGLLPRGRWVGKAIGAYVQCTSCNLGESCGIRYYFIDPNSTGCDHGVPNYVVEMAIPKSAVGMTGKNLTESPFPKVLWTCDTCGNDKIKNSIPEFMTVVIPAAALICFVFFIHRRRWGGGK